MTRRVVKTVVRTTIRIPTLRCSRCGFEDVPVAFSSPSSTTGIRCPRCGRALRR